MSATSEVKNLVMPCNLPPAVLIFLDRVEEFQRDVSSACIITYYKM